MLQSTSWGADCGVRLDPGSVRVEWTAFKTMQKLAVKGAFTEVDFLGELQDSKGLSTFLSQLEAEIRVKSEDLIRTGNPGRDLTLFQHFFKDFKKGALIHGAISAVKAGDREGGFVLMLSMNGRKRSVPMRYTWSKEGIFEATGNLDVLDFGLSKALADLHQTCEVLHRGPDGVSKTWPGVELRLGARILEDCR